MQQLVEKLRHRASKWPVISIAAMSTITIRVDAHHSFSAHYLPDQRAEIQGTVTRFDYRSPHSLLYIEVTSTDDTKDTWMIEFGSALTLRNLGWTAETFRPGDYVIVMGMPARTGASRMNAVSLVRPSDGFSYEH